MPSGALKGRRILLGLTGSIAVYKSIFLLRLLKEQGAEVQVLMSSGAREFVQPLTFSTLSGMPVLSTFHRPDDGHWHNHVSLGAWADLFVVVPLSAHTLSKMAHGHCDNLLLATYLSARSPLLLAPAMDVDMYAHPSTQSNLEIMRKRGHHILDAQTGHLASGLHGKGRMAEPEDIYARISSLLSTSARFESTRVLITAGPTREPLDPIRFIGNRSSGKMGIAIAEAFAAEGSTVDLILGPTSLAESVRSPRVSIHQVETAEEMMAASSHLHAKCQIAVFAAAVADYRPEQTQKHKIKKKKGTSSMKLSLVETPDIARSLGQQKKPHQLHIGFALETQDEAKYAQDKLHNKYFDLLVCNSLQERGAGFEHDTNKVSFSYRDGRQVAFPLQSKREVALDIVEATYALRQK